MKLELDLTHPFLNSEGSKWGAVLSITARPKFSGEKEGILVREANEYKKHGGCTYGTGDWKERQEQQQPPAWLPPSAKIKG